MSEPVGVVLGSFDATPLEFWIGVEDGHQVQLDDLVMVETLLGESGQQMLANGTPTTSVRFYGVVDVVRKKYEGTVFDGDAFRAAEGSLPVDVSYAAHVQVTRIDPEVFVPPHPGDAVHVVQGAEFERALYFDGMETRVPIGLTRTGQPVYANFEFLDGTRGAHVSISGVSGVATKTSYATFLLYALFHSDVLGQQAVNSKALIFNVKGEDLLWLDRPNMRLTEEQRARYARLGLPAGPFRSVALYAPVKRHGQAPVPDTGSRQAGVQPYLWTLREFGRERLLRFVFSEGDDPRAPISFVVERLESLFERAAHEGQPDDASLTVDGVRLRSFDELVDLLDSPALEQWLPNAAAGTLAAFRRRLHAAAHRLGHLVRGDVSGQRHTIDWQAQQVTVVDIHRLHSAAQLFVVGVLLKRMLDHKEAQGTSRPLVFVVLDELNKYAPREGWSPLREVLLDVAERGRSLGVSLFGAQQTASEVERRVLANAALKVVGRLDAAEAERGEYGFLSKVARLRASLLQPGSMIVSQPEIPTPVLLTFPFPAWATRPSEAGQPSGTPDDPFARAGE